MTWILLASAALAAILVLRGTRRKSVVIGQQLAAARQAEAARLAAGSSAPSPMPKDQYNAERGDYDLTSVTSLPLDASLQALAAEFKGWDGAKRQEARGAVSMDELYTLLAFARRSAALALKESSPNPCEAGLLALAMIDEQRIDWRDAAVAAALLAHSVEATRGARDELFTRMTALATPGMAAILNRQREATDLSAFGYAELRTATRVGLIQSDGKPYSPMVDLTGVALVIADTVNRGRYVASPKVATIVPTVWFAKERRDAAQKLLQHARGTVHVSGTLRGSRDSWQQMFMQWIAEMPTAGEAEQLVDDVGTGGGDRGRFTIGVARGGLFALLVAGSNVDKVEPVESRESIAELAGETRAVLERFATSPDTPAAPR